MPFELGLGHPLEYAIYWSPLSFIGELIDAGSSVNYPDDTGFPSLIAALSANRTDRLDLVGLLIRRGADLSQSGVNDWTPLHYAASTGDAAAVQLLLDAGADTSIRTRIDNLETPADEAERAGFSEIVALLRRASEAGR
jgi:ankyrin repeat protein